METLFKSTSKKGMVFQVGIVLIAIIALIYGYITLSSIHDDKPVYEVGEQQFALFQAYQDYFNEISMIELDLSDYVVQVIIDLASDGGFYKPGGTEGRYGGCGEYYGFSNWNTETKTLDECAPDDVRGAFEDALREVLPAGVYRIQSIQEIDAGTRIELQAQRDLTTGGSVRKKPETEYSEPDIPEGTLCTDIGACSPPLVSYEEATALHGPACQRYPDSYNPSVCRYTPRSDFDRLFSLKDPSDHHINVGNPDGNAITPALSKHLVNISERWYEQECKRAGKPMCDDGEDCCKAGIYVSSLSTATHAATSHHNIGNAADISRCYDADGHVSYALNYNHGKASGETFGRCYTLIKEYYKEHMEDGSSFIAPDDCLGLSCEGRSKAVQRGLMASHDDHVHINPPDPVRTS